MLPSKLNVLLHEAIAAGDTAVIEALEGDAGIKAVIRPIVDRVGLVWDECFEGCSLHHAKQLSSADRGQIENLASINLTYGEVSFHSLALAMCGHVDLKDKKVFYDVGSGSGRGCFCAALIHDFTKIRGVEIVPGLHGAAKTQHALYDAKILPRLREEAKAKDSPLQAQDLDFLCADFRHFDWSDADVVWANSTCFGTELMTHLSNFSQRMKEGSYFITLTQRLNSPHWELVAPGELYPMSWGTATIYIWKKVRPASANEDVPLREDA